MGKHFLGALILLAAGFMPVSVWAQDDSASVAATPDSPSPLADTAAPKVDWKTESRPLFDPDEFDRTHPASLGSPEILGPNQQIYNNIRERRKSFLNDQNKRRRQFIEDIRKANLSDEQRSARIREFNQDEKKRADDFIYKNDDLVKLRDKKKEFYQEQAHRRRDFLAKVGSQNLTSDQISQSIREFNQDEKDRERDFLEKNDFEYRMREKKKEFYDEQALRRRKFIEDLRKQNLSSEEESLTVKKFNEEQAKREQDFLNDQSSKFKQFWNKIGDWLEWTK